MWHCEAFAYLTGVDIPGVRVPEGAPGDDAPTSATGALRWVRAHWDELGADQRASIEAFTRPGPNDLVLPVTGSRGEPLAGADLVASLDGGLPRGPVPRPQVSDAAAATIGDAIRDDLFATLTHIGKRLGLPEITEGLFLKDVTLTLSERETHERQVNNLADAARCRVRPLQPVQPDRVQEPVVDGDARSARVSRD